MAKGRGTRKARKSTRAGKGPNADGPMESVKERLSTLEEEQETHATKIQKIIDTMEVMANNERRVASTQAGVIVKMTEQQREINRLMEVVTSLSETLADLTLRK